MWCSEHSGEGIMYAELKISEKGLNSLISAPRARHESPKKERHERARRVEWHDWVAALASLAYEHSIHSEIGDAEMRGLVELRLRRWDFKVPYKSDGSVARTIRAAKEHFRKNPPTKPET